jgi:hypothetical protein
MVVKQKDEAERMAKKTQATVQNLYKVIPEVPLVVEVTMEEQVHMIGEVIKGFMIIDRRFKSKEHARIITRGV